MHVPYIGQTIDRVRGAWRCRRGAAAVEYAFLAPVVVLLTLGILETMLFVSVRTLIDAGTREASRFGVTGEEVPGITREARIRQILEEKTNALIDPAGLDVSVTSYESFDQLINAGDPDPGIPGAGGGEAVVVYEVTYQQPLLTPYLREITGIDVLPQRARIVVQNEPF